MTRFLIFLLAIMSFLGCKAESDYENDINERVESAPADNATHFNTLQLNTATEGDYFVVETEVDSREFYYTNSKEFYFNEEGYLITDTGLPLLVLPVYSDGNSVSRSISVSEALKVDYSVGSPAATDKVSINANIPQDSGELSIEAFDRNNPLTYNYSISSSVFDSLGETHTITFYFINIDSENNTWSVRIALDDADVAVDSAKIIDFNSSGELDVNDSDSDGYLTLGSGIVNNLHIPLDNGADHLNIQLDFTSLRTSFNSNFELYSLEKTGFYTGNIESVKFESDGLIKLSYTNGEQELLGRVALARFTNPEGLKPVTDSVWQETNDSGVPTYGEPDFNEFGSMVPINHEL